MTSNDKKDVLESNAIINIAQSGDVLLIIGPEQKQIKVYSIILRCASKVFDTMLGPNFQEGQNLLPDTPKEILLPEDGAVGFELLLNVIHYRMDVLSDEITPDLICYVSVIAEKYGLVDAMRWTIRDWLRPKKTKTEPLKLWQLAIASFCFRDERAFAILTRKLIMSHDGSFRELEQLWPLPPIMKMRLAGDKKLPMPRRFAS